VIFALVASLELLKMGEGAVPGVLPQRLVANLMGHLTVLPAR
jgi:hypothetical protein